MDNFKKITNGYYESEKYIIKHGEYSDSRKFFTAWRVIRKADEKYCDCNTLKFAKEFAKEPLENFWRESQ